MVTPRGEIRASRIVDAAGAWAGELGRLAGAAPIELTPRRRCAIVYQAPEDLAVSRWPHVGSAQHSVYFEPESGGILMEEVPRGLDLTEIEAALSEVADVHEVHDLHAWTISSGIHAFSAHIRIRDLARGPEIVRRLESILRERFHLDHTTIQVEEIGFTEDAFHLPRTDH